jgi:hypothetical protein
MSALVGIFDAGPDVYPGNGRQAEKVLLNNVGAT